jgi:hypothetical protein
VRGFPDGSILQNHLLPCAEDDPMKTVLSWLGDPYLHLLAIGTIVVAIGTAGSSRGDVGERCDQCERVHDDSTTCTQIALKSQGVVGVR